jgi:hypothetical protein
MDAKSPRPRSVRAELEQLENRLAMTVGAAANAALPAFDIGSPSVADIWVDPAAGNDANGGAARTQAVRTLSEAWRRVPAGTTLSQGVRINLVAGTYSEAVVPNYWENRRGTFAAPIIVRAVDGAGTARLPTVNVFGCRHLYFDGLDISAGGGDVLHFEACTQILLRNTTVRGTGTIATYAVPQETLKVNQCQHVYIENCDISGAWDNAIDFVAVQYGHVVGSKIHRAGDWAMYAKGGSAQLTIKGNEFYDAGTGGFTAGQGTGFEFMVAPWLQYEASDITFTDNVIHDTQGAGIGVNGGSNIVMTNNTLYRVGARSHVIEVVFGSRSCDGDRAKCTAFLAQGGWGTNVVGAEVAIPNKNVTIANNVVLNPDGYASQWQQFTIATPRPTPAGSNVPTPARADEGLQIYGNIIWNGSASHPLGIEQPALATDVLARNQINKVRPVLVDPARGDYRVVPGASTPAPTPTPVTPPAPTPIPPPPPTPAPPTPPAVPGNRILVTSLVDTQLTNFQNQQANLGGASELQLYKAESQQYRALMKFDLAAIPAGTSVIEARIELYHTAGDYANAAMGVTLRTIGRDWDEGAGTDQFTAGAGASWRNAKTGAGWTTPGGDFVAADLGRGTGGVAGTATITPFTTAAWKAFDITPAVKGWLNKSIANQGVAIIPTSGDWTEHRFASSEYANAALRPRLVLVTAITPTPTTPQPPAALPPLTAAFAGVAVTTAQPVTSVTITFSRAVRGVTLDDFVLRRGTTVLSLAGAKLSTANNRTFTITNIRGTNLAASYSLGLKTLGTGIVDAAGTVVARPATVAWRMTRTVAAR